MPKQIQIDFELFLQLLDYFELDGKYEGADFLADEIRKQLDIKVDKIISRELFSRYKRTPTGAEREAFRKAYLDHKGVLQDWRTEKETSE